MTKNRFKWSAMTAAFVAASLAGSVALAAQPEVECNNPAVDSAGAIAVNLATGNPYIQPLDVGGSGVAVLDGTILNGPINPCGAYSQWRDMDFYSFTATEGQVLNIAVFESFEQTGTIMDLALFGPDSGQPLGLINQANYNYAGTGASVWDPSFPPYTVRTGGTYYIGLVTYPSWFVSMGLASNLTLYDPQTSAPPGTPAAPYTLSVSGLQPPAPPAPAVLSVGIEVRPGSHNVTVIDASGNAQPSGIRGNAKGSIPVALLSGKDFKPMDVDQSSLRFGKTGQEESLVSCNGGHGKDLNGDGVPDLVCHFDLSKAGFDLIDNQAVLTGKTSGDDGVDFKGTGWMKIMVTGLRPEDLVRGHSNK